MRIILSITDFSNIIQFLVTLLSTAAMLIAYFQYARDRKLKPVEDAAKHAKVVTMVTLITLGYVVTCGPMTVATICYMIYPEDLFHFYLVANTIFCFNGIVDVIVYSFMDEAFIKYLKKLVKMFLKKDCDANTTSIGVLGKRYGGSNRRNEQVIMVSRK